VKNIIKFGAAVLEKKILSISLYITMLPIKYQWIPASGSLGEHFEDLSKVSLFCPLFGPQ